MNDIFSIPFSRSDSSETSLAEFKGKYLLIVNVASKCGYTKQYAGLEQLQKEFSPRGVSVLGFPCNQFGGQEPSTDAEIQQFCQLTFGTTFPVFAKINVNGAKAHPLYSHLKSAAKGLLNTEAIKWNFTKFLVSPTGEVLKRYASATTPEEIAEELRTLLNK
jgi:glutathione peroxidase